MGRVRKLPKARRRITDFFDLHLKKGDR